MATAGVRWRPRYQRWDVIRVESQAQQAGSADGAAGRHSPPSWDRSAAVGATNASMTRCSHLAQARSILAGWTPGSKIARPHSNRAGAPPLTSPANGVGAMLPTPLS